MEIETTASVAEPAPESKLDRLIGEIEEVNANIKNAYDPRYIFMRGVLYGVAYLIGVTLVAGILFSLALRIPFVGEKIHEYSLPVNR
jgi:hypothetical protein